MGTTYQSVHVHAPIHLAWDKIKNFHKMDWTDGFITKLETVGDLAETEIGARRILNEAFHETLQSFSPEEYTFTYSIDDGPSPVSKSEIKNYIGRVKLYPITQSNTTFVEWSSSWDGDETACDFCSGIYTALLDAFEKSF